MEVTYNSRYLAYCKVNGLTVGEPFKTWEFIAWINSKVSEFKKMNGINSINNEELQERFTEYLFEEV